MEELKNRIVGLENQIGKYKIWVSVVSFCALLLFGFNFVDLRKKLRDFNDRELSTAKEQLTAITDEAQIVRDGIATIKEEIVQYVDYRLKVLPSTWKHEKEVDPQSITSGKFPLPAGCVAVGVKLPEATKELVYGSSYQDLGNDHEQTHKVLKYADFGDNGDQQTKRIWVYNQSNTAIMPGDAEITIFCLCPIQQN